jgi:hypothetical protein
MEQRFVQIVVHCKKSPGPFPLPRRDVTYQTLSSQEYVSLTKPEVFPDISFPSPEFLQIPFKSVCVPVCRQEFSWIFPSSCQEFFQDL